MTQAVEESKNFIGTKYFSHDFGGQDLSYASFNHGTFVDCSFKGCDLTHATFVGANCFGSNFQDSIMVKTNFKDAVLASTVFEPKVIQSITLTLNCDSIDKMKIGRTALMYWLFMPLRMESPDKILTDKIINAIGTDAYVALSRVFKEGY